MKVGLMFANVGAAVSPEGAVAIAEHAEAAGLDSLWTVEHVVVPGGYVSAYPYNPSGRMPGGEDDPIPDPLVWLAYVAARTTTLRLATGMLILPQRQPAVVAKEVATLDVLSGGRVLLGCGIGWLREEFEALGIPFERRGRRTEEYIEAMRALWRDDRPSYHGEMVSFDDARSWPKPVRRQVPIVIGGHGDVAARRAGRLGDGFFPGRGALDDLEPLLATMRRAAEESERDPAAIEVTVGSPLHPQILERLADLGVSRVVVRPRGLEVDEVRAGIDHSVARVRDAVGLS